MPHEDAHARPTAQLSRTVQVAPSSAKDVDGYTRSARAVGELGRGGAATRTPVGGGRWSARTGRPGAGPVAPESADAARAARQ